MATLDDKATEAEELFREAALKQRKPELPKIGECYWCGSMTIGVFCDSDCQKDYEQHERFNQ